MLQELNRRKKYKKVRILVVLCFLYLAIMTSCSKNKISEVIEDITGIQSVTPTVEVEVIQGDSPTGKVIILTPTPAVKPTTDDPTVVASPTSGVDPTTESDAIQETASTTSANPTPKATVTATPTPTEEPTKKPTQKPISTPTPKENPTVTPKPTEEPSTIITPPPILGSKDVNEYVKNVLDLIITDDMDDIEKVAAVHDYIISNTAYDFDNLQNDTIPDVSFTVEGVLWEKKAVCQGYAEAFQLFMELMGIESKVAVGTATSEGVVNSHAWNMISLNGEWYHVDTTWDDPVPDQKGKVRYNYFMKTDDEIAVDHEWKRSDYPVCDSVEFRYYAYQDYIIESIDQYEVEYVKRYNAGERIITILYPEEGTPNFDFMLKNGYLKENAEGKYCVNYEQLWRLGDYTVLTVMME